MPSLRIIEERQYVDDPDACQTKADLVTKYQAAVNEFNRTVNFLNDDIRAWTEKARLKVEQARVNLDQHIAGHHC
jgi:hypothetical protein